LANKQSKGKKNKTKASAKPKVAKSDIATSESVLVESAQTTKGLKAEDIKAVIDADLDKMNMDEINSVFTIEESASIDLTGKKTTGVNVKISAPKVVALPTIKVLEVLSTIWTKNREKLISKGFSKKNSTNLAGSTLNEFMDYLDLVVPDEFEPKNQVGRKLKSEHSTDWKLNAVNVEHVNRTFKRLMANGKIRIISVSNKSHFVPISCMLKNVRAYYGSLWHIKQIKNVLYATKQWNSVSQPYNAFFKAENPLNLTFKEFENVLSQEEKTLEFLWTSNGFDPTNLKGLGKATT
jgi:hypothetical protein